MELFEQLETSLALLVGLMKFILETISIFCVVAGLIKTIQLAVSLNRRSRGTPFPYNKVRLLFGTWLALALEFQLGADILATTIAPSEGNLIKLGVIAVIRTLLNYFLGKELEAEYEMEKDRAEVVAERAVIRE